MSSALQSFLESLNDHELSIFYAYQRERFLPHAKEKITIEIERRNLSITAIELYSKTKLLLTSHTDFVCERCGSDRYILDTEIEHTGNQHYSKDFEIQSKRCRLCHFNSSKDQKIGFLERLKRFVGLSSDKNAQIRVLKTYHWLDRN